jgi:hypothetical protein
VWSCSAIDGAIPHGKAGAQRRLLFDDPGAPGAPGNPNLAAVFQKKASLGKAAQAGPAVAAASVYAFYHLTRHLLAYTIISVMTCEMT